MAGAETKAKINVYQGHLSLTRVIRAIPGSPFYCLNFITSFISKDIVSSVDRLHSFFIRTTKFKFRLTVLNSFGNLRLDCS